MRFSTLRDAVLPSLIFCPARRACDIALLDAFTVKVVDGRPFNEHSWVFAASLTNVQFTLTVTDISTGQTRTYRNGAGQQSTIADTAAF
ncbi:MAG: hypothetical protein M3S32_02595 [Acidobacteriota bacterium]|nr:hypothetical protein [Acidobacteriota bacterium]